MSPEEIEAAATLAFSSEQARVLCWIEDGKVYEDVKGLYGMDVSPTGPTSPSRSIASA